ncbi:MAG TPA: hypothetical protein VL633_12000 [Bacteroidota bacterium]|nr:hypothetical protein [Bacteroidota bacterium]
MEKGVLYYYYFILQYSPLIPLVLGAVRFRHLEHPRRLFLLYLLVSLLLTIAMTILALRHQNNLWLMNLGFLVYAGIILWTFSMWQKNHAVKRIFRGAIAFFCLVWGAEFLISQNLFSYTVITKPTLDILFIAAACITIFQANNETDVPVVDQPKFWIGSGILLYYGGILTINLLSKELLGQSQDTLRAVLYIQPALNLAAHLLYLNGYRLK